MLKSLCYITIPIVALLSAVPLYDFTNLYIYQPQHEGRNWNLEWTKYDPNMCSDVIFSGIGTFWKPYVVRSNDPSCLGNLTIVIKTTHHLTIDRYFDYLRYETGIHATSTYQKYENTFRTYYFTTYTIQGADARRKQIIANDVYDRLRGRQLVYESSPFEFNKLEQWCINKTVVYYRTGHFDKNETKDIVLFNKQSGRYMYYSYWKTGRRKEYEYNTLYPSKPLGEFYLKRFTQIFENNKYRVLMKLGNQYDNTFAGFAFEYLEYNRKNLETLMA